MAVSLARLLAETPLGEARPEELAPCHRAVTWVHSSEIYEIAPLLDGGEVLLTTGLGLVGADDAALARYAEGIADRHAAALALELGRTFVDPPPALVAACNRAGLGLLALHAVVPFARIARVANELILDHEASLLRRATDLSRRLADDLRHRVGVRAMVGTVADAVGAPVQLVDGEGRVHAGPDRLAEPVHRQPVELASGTWGQLAAAATADDGVALLLEVAADTLQVAIAEVAGGRARDEARTLLLDLIRGTALSVEAVGRRAGALGVAADRPVASLVAVPDGEMTPPVADAVVRAVRGAVRTELAAVDGDRVLAVVDPAATRRATAERIWAAVDRDLQGSGSGLRHLAIGTRVGRLDRIGDSFGVALLATAMAARMGAARRVLLATDVALDRLLLETDDAALERLVARVLGPLLEHDAKRRTELLPTLVHYLAAGRSKATAATHLGVRRQTVHERLDRIARMLDLPTEDPMAWTSLEVAVRAWQIRTAAARRD